MVIIKSPLLKTVAFIVDLIFVIVLLHLLFLMGDGAHFLFPHLDLFYNTYIHQILIIFLIIIKALITRIQNNNIAIFNTDIQNVVEKPWLVALVLASLLLIGKFSAFSIYPYWDAAAYIIPASTNILKNNFDPITDPFWDIGHPTLLMELIALSWKIFAKKVWASYLPTIICAYITLLFTYLVGRKMYSAIIGFWSAILLFSMPLFFAHSCQALMPIPVAAGVIVSVWAILEKRYFLYFISASAALLFEEMGFLIVPLLALNRFISKEENLNFLKRMANAVFAMTPGITLLIWISYHYHRTGWFLFNESFNRKFFDPIEYINIFCKFLRGMTVTFGGCWIITLAFLIWLVLYIKTFRKDKLSYSIEKAGTLLLLILLLGYFALHACFHEYIHRYMLPVAPFFFILGVKAIYDIFENKAKYILTLILVCSVAGWIGTWKPGVTAEDTLAYMNIADRHRQAINHIKANYPEGTKILCNYGIGIGINFKESFYNPYKKYTTIQYLGGDVSDDWDVAIYDNTVSHFYDLKCIIESSGAKLKAKFDNYGIVMAIYNHEDNEE